jgi:C-terminal processing protease CtpA/Prc
MPHRTNVSRLSKCLLGAAVILIHLPVSGSAQTQSSQQMPPLLRDQALQMLRNANDTVKKQYYDQKFHGVDLESRGKEAERKIRDAKSFSEALGLVAWNLDALNDSHTFFIPPPRPVDIQNGWEMGFVGDSCFITAVQENSDAAAQSIKPGDQVLAIEGFKPTRQTLWKLHYAFNALAPRSAMHLVLVSPGGQPRQVEVKSSVVKLRQTIDLGLDPNAIWDIIRKFQNYEHESSVRHASAGDVDIEKIPDFLFSDDEMEKILKRVKEYEAVVLDLRGNPGGSLNVLSHFTGGFLDHEVKIADQVGRKDQKPLTVKSRGDHAFNGKLVVLVDSGSASCTELLARLMQLEKRGVVMGDLSSGSVMESKTFPFGAGVSGDYSYGFSVTVSDLVMSDGKSLEHVGVTPDQLLLPTAEDLAAQRDPVLAKAVESLGGKLTPEAAGKIFPVVWHRPIAW